LERSEPIYTLIHGIETENAVQTAHHKIKMELLEAKEN